MGVIEAGEIFYSLVCVGNADGYLEHVRLILNRVYAFTVHFLKLQSFVDEVDDSPGVTHKRSQNDDFSVGEPFGLFSCLTTLNMVQTVVEINLSEVTYRRLILVLNMHVIPVAADSSLRETLP